MKLFNGRYKKDKKRVLPLSRVFRVAKYYPRRAHWNALRGQPAFDFVSRALLPISRTNWHRCGSANRSPKGSCGKGAIDVWSRPSMNANSSCVTSPISYWLRGTTRWNRIWLTFATSSRMRMANLRTLLAGDLGPAREGTAQPIFRRYVWCRRPGMGSPTMSPGGSWHLLGNKRDGSEAIPAQILWLRGPAMPRICC